MFVYLQGDVVKGIPENHYVACNPGQHPGVGNVVSTLTEKGDDGKLVGRTFHIHFINGRADTESDALGRYLIEHGHALAAPWQAPPGAPVSGDDPSWRWREGR